MPRRGHARARQIRKPFFVSSADPPAPVAAATPVAGPASAAAKAATANGTASTASRHTIASSRPHKRTPHLLFHPTRFLDLNTTLNRTMFLNGCKIEALYPRRLTMSVYLRLISPFPESHVLQVVHGRRTTTPPPHCRAGSLDHHPTKRQK